jgi:raffinose/stachyose/melibiose transport system substrate-binding protein
MTPSITRLRHLLPSGLWRLGALGALLAASLAGGSVPAMASTAPMTLRIWYGSDDPTEQAWSQALAQQFAAQHPSIKVQFSFYDLDDMNDKTQLAMNTPNPPDLLYSTPRGPGLPAYVRAGKLLDLTAAARANGWAGALRPGLLASYNAVLDANGPAGAAGHIYAVPYLLAADAILYNKAIFSTLHLQVPRTMGQFAALLPRLKQAGYTPLGFGNQDAWTGDAWYLTLLNAQVGPAALQPALALSPSFRFTTAPFQQAAATLQAWVKAGYFSPQFGGLDPQDAIENFFDHGTTAMQLISSTENAQILAASRDDDSKAPNIGAFPFPAAQAGQLPVIVQDGYSGWAIPSAGHNQSAALTFINFALSAATTRTLLAQGLIPAHRVNASSVGTAAPFQRDFLTALATATKGVYVDAAPIPDFLATMEAQIQQLLAGKETPQTMVNSLQSVYASHGRTAQFTDTDGEF